MSAPHLSRPCVPSRPPLPDFTCWGRNATATAAEWIATYSACKGGECDYCQELGPSPCWRHERMWESAERIVRRQRREREKA